MWPLSGSARKRLAAMPAGPMLKPTANYFERTRSVLKGGFTFSKQEWELVHTKYQANWLCMTLAHNVAHTCTQKQFNFSNLFAHFRNPANRTFLVSSGSY